MPDGQPGTNAMGVPALIPANRSIWDSVTKTDPAFTKPVSYGQRKFTSIDAMYQLMRATELFGPVGKGWGWEATYSEQAIALPETDRRPGGQAMVQFCDVILWWRWQQEGERYSYGPVRGCNLLANANGHIDEDAPKKAMTDALTKALSHLGFSSDVFMGRFDDNKYVQQVRSEFDRKKASDVPTEAIVPKVVQAAIDDMRKRARSAVAVEEHYATNLPLFEKQTPTTQRWIKMQYRDRRDELLKGPPTPGNEEAGP